MSNDWMNRRRVLQAGGTALVTALAGCNEMGEDDQNNDENNQDKQDNNEQENKQQYTLPPVIALESDGVPDDGTVTIRPKYKTAVTPGDPNLYFKDKITFELFVYDKFPVGNSVTLTKVAEKTTAPYNTFTTPIDVSFEDLPKNQQMRFRLKVTNNNTGDSEWAMDQRVFAYEQFGDDITTAIATEYRVFEGPDNLIRNDFYKEEDKYTMNFAAQQEFAAPELAEQISFSREAYKIENDKYRATEGPVCVPMKCSQINMPASHVDMTAQMKENYGLSHSYSDFTFRTTTPPDYNYYDRGTYDVLNNPIYEKMAETVLESNSSYGVNNHYSKIVEAMKHIQVQEYEAIPNIDRAPIYLPEQYWADPATNCVGHSFQLCWFLYHMGYTCGTVWLDRPGYASHLGVAMPIPEDVMESDFPDEYPDTFTDDSTAFRYIENISEIVSDEATPDQLGDHPWVYMEATAPSSIGIIPFASDTIREARVRFALEPEDNVFGTDIGVSNGR